MTFPKDNSVHFLDTYARQYQNRYVSSGYELDKSEPPFSDGAPIFDPILFYSKNSHLICSSTDIPLNALLDETFTDREESNYSPILLLFPDFPWIKDCTRVKLMKRRDSSSTDKTEAEFSPTGSYSLRPPTTPHRYPAEPRQLSQYFDQPPSQLAVDYLRDVTLSHMYLTVLCQADDRCPCHGCVIRLNTVRKVIRNSPLVLTIYRREILRFPKETMIHHS
jgi:hypothetical protein